MNRRFIFSIPILVLILVSHGCNRKSERGRGDTALDSPPTEIGTPVGEKVTKEIGSAGGTLASPDGRITVTIPPNALRAATQISIQPITNQAKAGLGNAYRLEPNRQKFETPVDVTIKFTDSDLEGGDPEFLVVAYQDEQRVWNDLRTTRFDATRKVLTASTTHFTDMSFLKKMHISPKKATLRVGESIHIELVGCRRETDFQGQDLCVFNPEDPNYDQAKTGNWYADYGAIDNPNAIKILYTAPSKKPPGNVAIVSFPYDVPEFDETKGHRQAHGWFIAEVARTYVRGMFTAKITIIDWGYRATGQTADLKYSGVICSFDKPFTVNGSIYNYRFNFTPSSGTGGTYNLTMGGDMVVGEGGGTYTIEGLDGPKPRIAMTGTSTGHSPVGSVTRPGSSYIDLIPLDTNECAGKN